MARILGLIIEGVTPPDVLATEAGRALTPHPDGGPPGAHTLVLGESLDTDGLFAVAEALSGQIDARLVAFFADANVDAHALRVYRGGTCVRRLEYFREEGGWKQVHGEPEDFEGVYWFDEDGELDFIDDERDPDSFDAAVARAREDLSTATEVFEPTSTRHVLRVVAHFGLDAARADLRWVPVRRGWFARLFGRA